MKAALVAAVRLVTYALILLVRATLVRLSESTPDTLSALFIDRLLAADKCIRNVKLGSSHGIL